MVNFCNRLSIQLVLGGLFTAKGSGFGLVVLIQGVTTLYSGFKNLEFDKQIKNMFEYEDEWNRVEKEKREKVELDRKARNERLMKKIKEMDGY